MMKQIKAILLRTARPGIAPIVLLTPLCTAALIYVFVMSWEATIVGYIVYALSAYTLTVLVINMPVIASKLRAFIRFGKISSRVQKTITSNQYGSRYMTDISYRAKISLYTSLSMNLLYAAFKLIAGIYYASFWYGADAIYYIVLSAARIMLTRHMKNGERNLVKEYRLYRSCGILLFALNAALTGVVYQIVHQNMGYKYPGLLIYAVAMFAFINITLAIVNVVNYRKLNSPAMSSVKVLSLAKALVAMFALQSAMFASFNEDGENFERIMNSVIGGLVCLSIFAIAVFMVVRANRNLKILSINNIET